MTPGQEAVIVKTLAEIAAELTRIADALDKANAIAIKTAPRTSFGSPAR